MKELIQKALGFAKAIRKFFETEPLDEKPGTSSEVRSKYNSLMDCPLLDINQIVTSHFPENYKLDEDLLKAAKEVRYIYKPRHMLYYLLSNAKKVDSPRQPLPIKKSYSYMIWLICNPSEVNIETTLPKHPRLVEIREETLELSAAKAEILILTSGGDYFDVNHLLSRIDLTNKYVIICSAFDEDEIRDHVLYRVDRKIYPDFLSKKECLSFIDEIIQEATTIPLKA